VENHHDIRRHAVPFAFIGGPVLSWGIGLGALHGDGSGLLYALLFGALPFVVTFVSAWIVGKSAIALPAAIGSAAIGIVSWLAVAVLFAARFAN
jgi:hypothetical protein